MEQLLTAGKASGPHIPKHREREWGASNCLGPAQGSNQQSHLVEPNAVPAPMEFMALWQRRGWGSRGTIGSDKTNHIIGDIRYGSSALQQ